MKTIPNSAACVAAVAGMLCAQTPEPAQAKRTEPRPVDFAAVDRAIGVLPELRADKPLYALFLFGPHADKRVWAVLDRSTARLSGYDRLYLDLDADGDLTDDGECIEAEESSSAKAMFDIGTWRDPSTGAMHEKVSITWTPKRTSYRMMWRGEAITKGGYGPDSDSYGQFGSSSETAPVIVPGWDRPFEFERWYSGELTRGRDNDFKVFIGNRGSETGQFSCVDDEFLPSGEYPVATLLYHDAGGVQHEVHAVLTRRC